jgi:pimeloyl-ACP methyl ester carboxylesterase
MHTVTSKDGTRIAFDRLGTGPILIMVGGALQHRALDRVIGQRAEVLAQHFTVIQYDRRGRGDSGDTPPYAVEREIEDLEAVIDGVGEAYVLGMSSGGALVLEAAHRLGAKMKKMALYEVPYNDDPEARGSWERFAIELRSLLAADRRADALVLFMQHLGTASEQIDQMRHSPIWPMLEAVAHTLAYDIAVLGKDNSIPTERVTPVHVPALVLDGGVSFAFMHTTALALTSLLPNAEHRTLEDQTHAVQADVLAAALVNFFGS